MNCTSFNENAVNFTSFSAKMHACTSDSCTGKLSRENFRGFVKVFSAKFGGVASLAAKFLHESYETARARSLKPRPYSPKPCIFFMEVGLPA